MEDDQKSVRWTDFRTNVFINRNGLRWSDAPREQGSPKTLYNRWKRWSRMEVFPRMMHGLASEAADGMAIMINVEPGRRHWFERPGEGYLKAHRTASDLRVKKGGSKINGGA